MIPIPGFNPEYAQTRSPHGIAYPGRANLEVPGKKPLPAMNIENQKLSIAENGGICKHTDLLFFLFPGSGLLSGQKKDPRSRAVKKEDGPIFVSVSSTSSCRAFFSIQGTGTWCTERKNRYQNGVEPNQ